MKREVVRIDEVLAPLLRRLGFGRKIREARLAADWERVVGTRIARHSRPAGVRGRTLLVNVDSSAWLAELSGFFKEEIVSKIRKEHGGTRIDDVRFRIGDV